MAEGVLATCSLFVTTVNDVPCKTPAIGVTGFAGGGAFATILRPHIAVSIEEAVGHGLIYGYLGREIKTSVARWTGS